MTVTLGQQYNIGEKPTVILDTYINRHAGTPEKQRKQKSTSSKMVLIVIIYCYIGCDDEVTTLKREQRSRALSLRNLVSGYECGRVFPAGGGPGSPSRDAANWLLSRFGLSVETRRQYGWLRMMFSGVRLFRAPI